MEINFSFDVLSSLLSFVQAMLIGIFFLTLRAHNRKANIFLGVFLISLYFGDLHNFYAASGIVNHHPAFFLFPSLALFWLGPSLYYYIKSALDENFKWSKKVLYGYLPGIVEIIAQLLLFAQKLETKISLWQDETFWLIHHIYSFLAGVHAVAYVWAAIVLYKKYRKLDSSSLSVVLVKKIRWVKYFLYYWLVNFSIWLVSKTVILSFGAFTEYDLNQPFAYINSFLSVTSLMVIYGISYFTLKHLDVVSSAFQKEKYSNSKLHPETEAAYFKKLLNIIEEEKSYLNPNLKISDLALKLSTNPKYVSQMVNKYAPSGFIALINAYRIEAVKRKLEDPTQNFLTIAAIAEACGFNSKSTFTRVFREHVGMLPKEYKDQNQTV